MRCKKCRKGLHARYGGCECTNPNIVVGVELEEWTEESEEEYPEVMDLWVITVERWEHIPDDMKYIDFDGTVQAFREIDDDVYECHEVAVVDVNTPTIEGLKEKSVEYLKNDEVSKAEHVVSELNRRIEAMLDGRTYEEHEE